MARWRCRCWALGWLAAAVAGGGSVTGCTDDFVEMGKGGKAPGRIVTVDNSGDAGYYVAMDLDSRDRAHLVYYDKANRSLKYVRHAKAGFSSQVVDATCKKCLYAAILVTGDYEPHIAYYNDSTQTLTYAYRQDGQWKHEGIEWGRGNGMGAQLQLDDNGSLHALYYSGDGYLKHAWRVPNEQAEKEPAKPRRRRKRAAAEQSDESGKPDQPEQPAGIWGNEQVDKANGSEKVSIRFVRQPNGRFAASYFHWSGLDSEVRIAIQGPDDHWTTEVVDHEHNPGKSSALYFGRGGEPKVIYREARKDRLSLAELTIEGWKAQPLVPDAYNMAFDIDGTYNLLLAYERMSGRDPRKGHLRMAWRRDWKWFDYEIDATPGSGTHLAAGLTTGGQPMVAYFAESTKSLKLFIGE